MMGDIGFAGELYSYLYDELRMLRNDILMSDKLSSSLFDSNIQSTKTLLSPTNLQFFFENYKTKNYEAINDRFKVSDDLLDSFYDT